VTTVGEWLASREPAPPAALRVRIETALAADLARDARDLPDACLTAGERLVGALLRSNSTTRESALDLLAADALVTYAFEAASDAPGGLAERASRAMSRIAELGAVQGAGAPA
jgi:hypothetical protein